MGSWADMAISDWPGEFLIPPFSIGITPGASQGTVRGTTPAMCTIERRLSATCRPFTLVSDRQARMSRPDWVLGRPFAGTVPRLIRHSSSTHDTPTSVAS